MSRAVGDECAVLEAVDGERARQLEAVGEDGDVERLAAVEPDNLQAITPVAGDIISPWPLKPLAKIRPLSAGCSPSTGLWSGVIS